MRHEHLVVTVESGTKARIEDDLDPGETVEAWVADAIEEKLAGESTPGESDDLTRDDRPEEHDEYDEGFEYVDDCSI
jgi:IS4 transposase